MAFISTSCCGGSSGVLGCLQNACVQYSSFSCLHNQGRVAGQDQQYDQLMSNSSLSFVQLCPSHPASSPPHSLLLSLNPACVLDFCATLMRDPDVQAAALQTSSCLTMNAARCFCQCHCHSSPQESGLQYFATSSAVLPRVVSPPPPFTVGGRAEAYRLDGLGPD
jgi:hypothetical protein